MFRKYHLKPLTVHETDLEFEWDPESGAVRGRDAARVLELAAEGKTRGDITGDPYPTVHLIRDPLKSEAEMAVVLGRCWHLPETLQAAYPPPPAADLPEGAVA